MKLCECLRCAVLVLPLLLSPAAQSATVVWPAAILMPYSFDTATHVIGSDVSPGGGTGVLLELLSGPGPAFSLQADNMTAGIIHMWFATQYGAAVDESAMAGADFLARSDTMEFGSIGVPLNQIFYLGFRLDGPPSPDYPHPPSYYIYGWAALLWNGTTLALVDSAAETTGVGIYAGTYDAIPEPTTVGLLLAGLAILAVRRRRMRRPGG